MGIRLVVGKAYSLDMDDYDFTGIDDAAIKHFGSSKITGTAGKFSLTITGQGFDHDSEGYLTDGTIHGISLKYHGSSMLSLSGAKVSIEKLIDVLNTYTVKDDIAYLKHSLHGNDYISGSRYSDFAIGYGGDDTLLGRDGNDRLKGGNGRDDLVGGGDQDALWGNAGADRFIFLRASDSSAGNRDTVKDFSRRHQDKIDLHEIDAKLNIKGDQDFAFIGHQDFHDRAGELRYEDKGKDILVEADLDGDGSADMAILLKGVSDLSRSDFLL